MNPVVKNGNRLRWKFENIASLTEEEERTHCQLIQLIGKSASVDNCKYLSVGLCYDSDNKEDKNWICETRGKLKLLKRGGKIDYPVQRCFLSTQKVWGIDRFLYWATVMFEKSGFLCDNSITVEVDFSFKYYDFSKIIPSITDITVNVEDTVFYLNKWALSSRSGYFNKFIVNSKPSKSKFIKLEDDLKAEHFCYMLASFYPFFQTDIDHNYVDLIKLAGKFDVPSLHYKCEQYLINDTKLELIEKIKYADENDYENLMQTCIESLSTAIDVKKLQADPSFASLKDSTKLRIMYRILDFF